MKTYLARLVFQVDWEPQQTNTAFEEQIRLIIAEDKLDAYTQANACGHTELGEFPFYRGGSVNWKFLGLTSLDEIGQIHSGMLIDSSQRNHVNSLEDGKLLQAQIQRFNNQLEVETMQKHRIL
jgi:hypothetical protein